MLALLRFVRVILAQGHANLPCIVPILTDDPRRESERQVAPDADDDVNKDEERW